MRHVDFKSDKLDFKLLLALSKEILYVDLLTQTTETFFDQATPNEGVAGSTPARGA